MSESNNALPTAVAGSSFYYATLPLQQHPRGLSNLLCMLELCDALASTLHEVSDPGVAEQKIHWWHEELQRFAVAASRHPATRRLQHAGFNQPSVVKPVLMPMLAILQANNEERFNNAADTEQFEQRLLEDYRARDTLVRYALTLPAPDADADTGLTATTAAAGGSIPQTVPASGKTGTPAWLQQLLADAPEVKPAVDNESPGAAGALPRDQLLLGLAHVERLRRFHRLYHHGLPVWPDSLYAQLDVTVESLRQPDQRQQSLRLQQHMIEHAESLLRPFSDITADTIILQPPIVAPGMLQRAADSTPAGDGRTEVGARLLWDDCLRVLAILRSRQLQLWQRQQLDLLQSYSTLTPLRKSWIAMRQHRALRKAHRRHNPQDIA